MGKLFDNLPRRFFNPLAAITNGGSQQEFYAECMLAINSLFADRTQVSREDLKDFRDQLGLDGSSRVLLFSTEGDTDPAYYRRVVWDGAWGK